MSRLSYGSVVYSRKGLNSHVWRASSPWWWRSNSTAEKKPVDRASGELRHCAAFFERFGSHCQLTVAGGYWYVSDQNSRNGIKVNGARVDKKRVDPGDVLSIAKHKYELQYSPAELGAVGPPPSETSDVQLFGTSLLDRAGLAPKGQGPQKNSSSRSSTRFEILEDIPLDIPLDKPPKKDKNY